MTEDLQPELSPQNVGEGQTGDAAGRLRLFLLACTAYVLFNFSVKLVPVSLRPDHMAQFLAMNFIATAIFMLLQLWVPWTVAFLKLRPITQAIVAVASGLIWFGFVTLLAPHRGMPFLEYRRLFRLSQELQPFTNLFATCSLAFLGCLLSRIVKEAKILLPVGVISGVVDVVGAMTPVGLTAGMLAKHPDIVQKVSISVPTVGTLQPISLFGPGDVLFLGIFFATAIRFGMNLNRSFWWTFGMLAFTMLGVVFGLLPQNVGALLPMGIAMIAANREHFTYTREEKFAMLYAGAIVLVGAVVFFMTTHRLLVHHR